MSGTNGAPDGTSGPATGPRLPSPDARLPERSVLALVAAVTLGFATVNALTVWDDSTGRLDAWEPWAWEMTSAAFWIAAALPLIRIARALRPPRLGWATAVAALLLLSVPVCGLHIAWLAASRSTVYAALGARYDYDWTWAHVVYEWRKDLLSVLVFAGMGAAADRWMAASRSGPVPPPAADRALTSPFRLEVRDGARRRWFAAHEIERVEAAGNYVELHTDRGAVLHRATLASVADELGGHGFVRIHRSRLVRAAAVLAVETTPAGDFEVALASGAKVAGSRRFRSGLG